MNRAVYEKKKPDISPSNRMGPSSSSGATPMDQGDQQEQRRANMGTWRPHDRQEA